MATFEYRCDVHGSVDIRRPIGTAPLHWPCPVCQQDATRVITAPGLCFASRELMAVIDRAERTGDAPEVVSCVPAAGARRRARTAPPNPALRRLPRP